MAETPLANKLLLKPAKLLALIAAPEGYRATLDPLPPGVQIVAPEERPCDIVQAFVRDQATLTEVAPKALRAVKAGGIVWFIYPKRTGAIVTDITRDVGWEPLHALGWRPVTQIAIDATWSALRFRPESEVGT